MKGLVDTPRIKIARNIFYIKNKRSIAITKTQGHMNIISILVLLILLLEWPLEKVGRRKAELAICTCSLPP